MGYSEIQLWLTSERPYQQGVGLLEKYGASSSLIFLLNTGENDFTRRKLKEGLEEILDAKIAEEPKPVIPVQKEKENIPAPEAFASISEAATKKKVVFEQLPETLKPVWLKIIQLFKEQDFLHARLKLFPTNEERLQANLRILDIDDERKELYRKIDQWLETGTYEEKKEERLNPFELLRKQKALDTQIRKYKAKDPGGEKLKSLKAEKAAIDKLIEDEEKSFQQR